MPPYRSRTTTHGRNMAGARGLWRATGMKNEDFGKPIIAVVNSFTQFVPGHVHLQNLGQLVAREIEKAGGVAKEFNTVAVDDGIAMGHDGMLYSLPSREIIADSVEYMVNAHCADAMVCISNCDKITPGMLMAAMRLNIPVVFVSGGPMEAGKVKLLNPTTQKMEFKKLDLIDAMVMAADDKVSDADVAEVERSACPTCGSCSGMFTANSMNCLTEALGLSLPGNGTVVATHADREQLFKRAGHLAVELCKRYYEQDDETVLPRSMGFKAFENAIALDIAMGGSTNTILHILAIAQEAEIDFTMADIDRMSKIVPQLCKVAPNTNKYHIEDVHRAGGIMGILGELDRAGRLHTDVPTVHSKTMKDALEQWDIARNPSDAVKTFYMAGPGGIPTQVAFSQAARWPSLGYPNLLEIGRPSGAKIGQTADGRQTWTAGYTPQRLVVTWIGQPADEQPATTPLDPRLSAGLWNALIRHALRDQPATTWNIPAGVSKVEVCSPSGLLPTQACPLVVSEYFLVGNEPTGPDSLYRTFQINRETGLLATVFTPPEQVEERTFLVLPPEAQTWGKLANLPVPPQSYDRIQPPTTLANVQISSPAPFSVVRGQVAIRGSAAGESFSYYQLQAGEGLNPATWLPIGEPVTQAQPAGLLGAWDTSGQNGLFALRLQVVRQNQRLETALIQVTVDNTPPRLRILNLLPDQHLAYESRPLTFQVEAGDSVGLDRVEFSIDGALAGSRPAPPYNQTWSPQRGPHTLKVTAYDLAGNTSETTLRFWID